MFIPESEREGRKEALGSLKKAMSEHLAGRVKKPKPEGVAIEIEAAPVEDEMSGLDDLSQESEAEDEPSPDQLTPDEVQSVRELLRKMGK